MKIKLLENNQEIMKLKKQLNNLINIHNLEKNIQQTNNNSLISTRFDKDYLYDKQFFKSNYMLSSEDINRIGYYIIYQSHTIEKGLSHFILRPFGQKKIASIINLLKKDLEYKNYKNDFSFINGINILRKYKKTYEIKNWTDKIEYKNVSIFLKNFENIEKQKVGSFILTREELKKDYNINYEKFIKSRHSTRNYKNLQLKDQDIKKAIEMAKYTPSACNRQYIKVHYYPKGKMKNNIIDYSLGKNGIYLEGVNTFIITFDVNGLISSGERNQGYFNAGLFSMNLVNAFHSLGIGSCFIQFANTINEETKLKKLNQIPSNERIAVILYAGYYDEKSIFAESPRKQFEDYFKQHL